VEGLRITRVAAVTPHRQAGYIGGGRCGRGRFSMEGAVLVATRGHGEYCRWLDVAGRCFSPLHPCVMPLRAGPWWSWTIEGFYQGLKLFAILDVSLIDRGLGVETVAVDGTTLVHVPAIMDVHTNLRCHDLFRLLKSGHKYDSRRNRCLGRLRNGGRNWAWTNTWRHPLLDIPVGRDQFRTDVLLPVWREVLSRHAFEVSRLRALWAEDRATISDDMRKAHHHLSDVERLMDP